ncbi:sigma-70 family RNA polymerase sigma factor [Anaerostipes sp.]|uniref:sigma-70 family RNA polymerase sigma factor n=1 Tax=Anaerostipes sp. TaxID=1872530 RepID=UPI0025C68D08|nr:sigma-70 family RNA polymerase sigma factor [Anaerostipes sp.]MBS7008464.1 sigma-70 family RNA polymerase sigma factor [Anaerostipes sp.]
MDNETLVQQIKQGYDVKENMGRLYEQNKGLIYNIVKKYRYIDHMTDLEDLMNQSYIALAETVEKYDPAAGASFSTFVMCCIGQSIHRYLDNTGRSMRIPVHIQEKIYKYNQVTSHFLAEYNREPTDQEYMRWMHMSEKQLYSLRKTMHVTAVESIEKPLDEDMTIADAIADPGADMEVVDEHIDQDQLKQSLWPAVKAAVKDMNDYEVLISRYQEDCTLKEAGRRKGVTAEQARARQSRALRQLRSNRKIIEIGKAEGLFHSSEPSRKERSRLRFQPDDYTEEELKYMAMAGVM